MWSLLWTQRCSQQMQPTWRPLWKHLQPFCPWAVPWSAWSFFLSTRSKRQSLQWWNIGSNLRMHCWKEGCQWSTWSKSSTQSQTAQPGMPGICISWPWLHSTVTLRPMLFINVFPSAKGSWDQLLWSGCRIFWGTTARPSQAQVRVWNRS